VAKRVAAGHLGRKSGRGWYEYPPGRPADPEPLAVTISKEVPTEWESDVSLLPPLGRLVEIKRDAPEACERFFTSQGLHVERVGDFVLLRIVAQLVNEACFALGEGTGSAADIDAGMELGLNHPRGPLAWGDLIGPARVLAILRGLQEEYGDDRWRPAPRLLHAARRGEPLASVA
jgi:3-hydroxyacyl-CoA dehydrogenase